VSDRRQARVAITCRSRVACMNDGTTGRNRAAKDGPDSRIRLRGLGIRSSRRPEESSGRTVPHSERPGPPAPPRRRPAARSTMSPPATRAVLIGSRSMAPGRAAGAARRGRAEPRPPVPRLRRPREARSSSGPRLRAAQPREHGAAPPVWAGPERGRRRRPGRRGTSLPPSRCWTSCASRGEGLRATGRVRGRRPSA
jgi:hypothetical protein